MSAASSRVSISSLPIIDIIQDNIADEWNGIIAAIQECSFIAIDIVNIISNFFNGHVFICYL